MGKCCTLKLGEALTVGDAMITFYKKSGSQIKLYIQADPAIKVGRIIKANKELNEKSE